MSYSSYDHDDLEPASTMRIERRIYFESGKADLSEMVKLPLAELLSLRDRVFGSSTLYGRWDGQALAYQQRETQLLGGEILSFSFEGEPGYAVCHPAGELVLIKEWGFSSLCEPVFAAIARRFGRKTLRLDLPALPDEAGARPFAMTRWYLKERKREDGTPPILSLVLD